MKQKPTSGFLNVDLEIVSRFKLTAIEVALDRAAHVLYCGPFGGGKVLLSLECNRQPNDADTAIVRLCTAVEGLSEVEHRIWKRALSRTFDVGYELGRRVSNVHLVLRPKTLERVVAIGATVAFTCYHEDNRSRRRS